MKVDAAVRIAVEALHREKRMPTNNFRLDARISGTSRLVRFIFEPEAPDFALKVRVHEDGRTEIMSGY